MTDYQPPQIIASLPTDRLVADAAACTKYGASDADLKNDIRQIDRPLGGLRTPRD